jgi:hypothetical protein
MKSYRFQYRFLVMDLSRAQVASTIDRANHREDKRQNSPFACPRERRNARRWCEEPAGCYTTRLSAAQENSAPSKTQPCPSTGMLGKPTPGYEIDYVVPLVLGGEITTPWTGGIVR